MVNYLSFLVMYYKLYFIMGKRLPKKYIYGNVILKKNVNYISQHIKNLNFRTKINNIIITNS